MYQYSQTVGLRGRREETQTSASGQGGLSRQCWVCAHALAGATGCSPQRSCCWEGVDRQHCSPRDGHTDVLQHSQQ